VDAPADALETTDFPPFRALRHMPWAMTAHVVYAALDKDNPATTSERVVRDTIRDGLGFEGVLVSDDIGMKALSGSFAGRASAVLSAGCDLVLHCSGDMAEMEDTAKGIAPLSADAAARLARAETMLSAPADWDADAARARLEDILETAP